MNICFIILVWMSFLGTAILIRRKTGDPTGWAQLSQNYPATDTDLANFKRSNKYYNRTIRTEVTADFSGGWWISGVTISMSTQGLLFNLTFRFLNLFRSQSPFFLPWNKIVNIREVRAYIRKGAMISLANSESVTIYGKPSLELIALWEKSLLKNA